MPTVSAGSTATYTLTSAQSIAITFDANESASVSVSRSGSVIFSQNLRSSTTIGPYLAGDVMTLVAERGPVDYTTATAPDGPNPASSLTSAQVTAVQALAIGAGVPSSGFLSALLFGDSLQAAGGGDSPSPGTANYADYTSYNSNCYFNILNIALGAPFRYVFNASVGTQTTTQMLARIDSELGSRTWDVGFFEGGINNFIQRGDTTPDATIVDIAALWTKLRARCGTLYVHPIWPNDSITAPQRAAVLLVNAWIYKNAKSYGAILLTGLVNTLVDPADSNSWALLNAYTDDNTHPNTAGSCAAGNVLALHLDVYKTRARYSSSDGSNLLANGALRGTAGSAPTSWVAFGSLTITYPSRTDGESGTLVQAVAADFATIRQNITSGYTVGRRCVAEVEYTCNDPTASINLQIQMTGGTSTTINALKPAGSDASTWALPASGVLRTPEFVIVAGTTTVGVYLLGSKAATYQFGRAVLRYVD